MKKIIVFLVLLFVINSIVIYDVNGDSASAIMTLYDVIVTNPNGTVGKSKDNDDVTFAYGSKLTVLGFYESERLKSEEIFVKYNNVVYHINLDDVAVSTQDYPLENAKKMNYKENVFTLYDVKIYKGPSKLFEEVGTIPKHTEISYEYIIDTEDNLLELYLDNTVEAGWVYIEYNGLAGWILTYDGYRHYNVGYPDSRYVKLEDKNMYEVTNNTDINIPIGTTLKCLWTSNGIYGRGCLAEYDGILVDFGYLNTFFDENEDINDVINNQDDTEENTNEIKVSQEKKSYYNMIYLYVGAAILIALSAGVMLIIINKKNNK